MTQEPVYTQYTEALRGFLAPKSRGFAGPTSPDAIANQADQLASLSASAIKKTAGHLADEDTAVRVGAEQRLLAQAAASLQVADALLVAAAGAGEIDAADEAESRGFGVSTLDVDALLAVLEAPLIAPDTGEAAGFAARASLTPIGAEDLVDSADAALVEILDDTTSQGRDALAGLLGLDVALIKQAAGMISADLAEVVAKLGEQASRLVARAMAFVVQAYDSLLAAVGQDAASQWRQQAAAWLERLQKGEAMSSLLGMAYEVPVTQQKVRDVVAASQATGDQLAEAQAAVTELPGGFGQRTKLANQLLAGLGVLRRFPAARVPLAELGAAAVYLLTLGFIIYVGGDYVDAPKLERLDRVPGVLHVIEAELGT